MVHSKINYCFQEHDFSTSNCVMCFQTSPLIFTHDSTQLLKIKFDPKWTLQSGTKYTQNNQGNIHKNRSYYLNTEFTKATLIQWAIMYTSE